MNMSGIVCIGIVNHNRSKKFARWAGLLRVEITREVTPELPDIAFEV